MPGGFVRDRTGGRTQPRERDSAGAGEDATADAIGRRAQLAVIPTAAWEVGEPRPGFDQHPIAVSPLADACARVRTDRGGALSAG